MKPSLEGLQGSAELLVTSHDTALAFRSGDVAVLATPRLIALLEEATCAALDGALEPDLTTVGTAVDISHRRPTPVGARVRAHAHVAAVDGQRVVFEVHADHQDADGRIVEAIVRGRITRVIVERDSFAG